MWKLFDQDFFKFLIGFLFILIVSFSVFFVIAEVNSYTTSEVQAEQ